jgi:hypothetical protein
VAAAGAPHPVVDVAIAPAARTRRAAEVGCVRAASWMAGAGSGAGDPCVASPAALTPAGTAAAVPISARGVPFVPGGSSLPTGLALAFVHLCADAALCLFCAPGAQQVCYGAPRVRLVGLVRHVPRRPLLAIGRGGERING